MSKRQFALKSLERIPLNQMVYNELKNSIVSGNLEPGSKLSEVHISKQLGVSATPVREALKQLSSEGYVVIKPYVGAVVRIYSVEELVNSYICREALEVLMVELAIPNIKDEDIEKLYKFLEKSHYIEKPFVFADFSTKIHNFILAKTLNNVLPDLLESLKETMYRDRSISAMNVERRNEIYEEHKNLIDAIAERNTEKAKLAMSTHIKNGLKYMMK